MPYVILNADADDRPDHDGGGFYDEQKAHDLCDHLNEKYTSKYEVEEVDELTAGQRFQGTMVAAAEGF